VLVAGDVNSTLAAALAAAKLGVPVIHLEAGLRSGDWTMPEEINRVLCDRLSDLLLCPTPDAVETLCGEGIERARAVLVGNTMIDTLFLLADRERAGGVPRRAAPPKGHSSKFSRMTDQILADDGRDNSGCARLLACHRNRHGRPFLRTMKFT